MVLVWFSWVVLVLVFLEIFLIFYLLFVGFLVCSTCAFVGVKNNNSNKRRGGGWFGFEFSWNLFKEGELSLTVAFGKKHAHKFKEQERKVNEKLL